MERDEQDDLDFDLPLIKEAVADYESHYRGGRLIRPSPRCLMTGGFDGQGVPSRGPSKPPVISCLLYTSPSPRD